MWTTWKKHLRRLIGGWLRCQTPKVIQIFRNNKKKHMPPTRNKWVFPKIGVTPQIINTHRVFHYFHHPFWGYLYFWKHPNVSHRKPPKLQNFCLVHVQWKKIFYNGRVELQVGVGCMGFMCISSYVCNRVYMCICVGVIHYMCIYPDKPHIQKWLTLLHYSLQSSRLDV